MGANLQDIPLHDVECFPEGQEHLVLGRPHFVQPTNNTLMLWSALTRIDFVSCG